MKKYIRSDINFNVDEYISEKWAEYYKKVARNVEIDLEGRVKSIIWDMKDNQKDADKVLVTVIFNDDSRHTFEFETWRFSNSSSYMSSDVDIIVNEILRYMKLEGLMEEDLWEEVAHKSVLDFDGFWTDYTMYYNPSEDRYVCIFGDRDLYTPENTEPDFECEEKWEAFEWFEDYDTGELEGEDDILESQKVECTNYNFSALSRDPDSEGVSDATDVTVWMYKHYPEIGLIRFQDKPNNMTLLTFEVPYKFKRQDELKSALDQMKLDYRLGSGRLYVTAPELSVEDDEEIEASTEFFDKGDGVDNYWYFTTHGIQPGSVPKGLDILEIVDTPNGTYFRTNKVLTTKSLNYYDIKERCPKGRC